MLAKNFNFNIKNFRIVKEYSHDIISKVVIARNIKTGEIYYARIGQNLENDEKFIIESKISAFSKLSHPSIQNIIGFSPKDFNGNDSPVIFSNEIPKYSLSNLIDLEKKSLLPGDFTYTNKYIIIYGIASGMSYLHANGIIHRNLCPSSIFLNENYYPKISDFIIRKNYENLTQQSFSNLDYLQYTAPELLESTNYDYHADIYSFGMLVYHFLESKKPFKYERDSIIINKIIRGERPIFDEFIPQSFRDLIESCWSQEPSKRPEFSKIVELLSSPDFISKSMEIVDVDELNEYIKYVNSELKIETKKSDEYDVVFKPISLDIESLDLSQFQQVKLIGSGISGEVYQIVHKKTGNIYAAKVYSSQISEETRDTNDSINFLRELDILSKISHPTILKYIGCSLVNFQKQCKPIIVTELLINNSLETLLEIERKGQKIPKWNSTRKFIFIYGIAFALNYLHLNKILHRDIKPGNVLIDDYLFPKICDFGFSKRNSKSEKNVNEVVGTPAFIAPEIYKECKYSEASDVYAYAMLLYEIMEQKLPFQDFKPSQIIYSLCNLDQRPEITDKTPKKYKELIKSCWNKDPTKRPTFQQIVKMLKTDLGFKFEDFDESLFNEYIQFIEQKKLPQKKYIIESYYMKCNDVNDYQIEYDGFITIDDYEEFEEILRDGISCYYDIIDKKTGQKYSARISNFSIQNYTKQEMQNISLEVKMLSKLKHPSIQKFHGFSYVDFSHHPNPVVISEHSSKRRLSDILEKERKGEVVDGWNDTKKLINIFGIASGMNYLHSKNIFYYNLNPKNIIVDDSFYPKITNIGFHSNIENSKNISSFSINGCNDSVIYTAPEVFKSLEKTKSSDVYSFSLIVYEIVTKKNPFKSNNNMHQMISELMNKNMKLSLDKSIPNVYHKLIKEYSEMNPELRPSFKKIIDILKSEPGFLTKSIDKSEYLKYINRCDVYY